MHSSYGIFQFVFDPSFSNTGANFQKQTIKAITKNVKPGLIPILHVRCARCAECQLRMNCESANVVSCECQGLPDSLIDTIVCIFLFQCRLDIQSDARVRYFHGGIRFPSPKRHKKEYIGWLQEADLRRLLLNIDTSCDVDAV